jgi:hypothetical protein
MKSLSALLLAVSVLLPCAAWALPPEDTRPIHFAATLSADEESAPTESPGAGRIDLTLDRATLTLSWVLTYKGLPSEVTGVHIRGPQRPGTNAGILFDLGKSGLRSPIKGSAVLNDGQLEYLLAGRMYVNIATTKYKDGELRGQIQRQRISN